MKSDGWIGVDLDGTLAFYDYWRGPEHIGAPIQPMVDRIRTWIAEGREVRIFTARAGDSACLPYIHRYCIELFGVALRVTNVKDFTMLELWDDRAVGVVFNTGMIKSSDVHYEPQDISV